MVFVLKLITIQDLLKEGKLSIIKNKMQNVCSIAIEWLSLRPLYLKQAKKQSRWRFVWNWPPKTITRQVPQKTDKGKQAH